MRTSDVIVVGAGPSGLRTAARLAGAGLDVRVLEKKARVGAGVVCTGIIGREVFEARGLDRGAVVDDLRRVRLVSPQATEFVYEHPRPFACVVDRERFDGGLARAAAAAGAEVVCGVKVEDVAVGRDGVQVKVAGADGGAWRESAAVAVLATGVDYALQKRTGLSSPRDFLKGAQIERMTPEAGLTTLFFGRNVAPGAFAWSVPAGPGRARIGLLTQRDPKGCLRRLIESRFDGAAPAADGPDAVRTRPVAQGLLARTCGDRILAVGEAAGQTKTTTGGGISYGLACADVAADVLLGCFGRGAFGAADLAAYERRWKALLRKEILVGQYTRRMCARLSDGRIESLFQLARTDGIVPIIRDKADFDWHSGLIFALLERLSFMKVFREVRDRFGPDDLS